MMPVMILGGVIDSHAALRYWAYKLVNGNLVNNARVIRTLKRVVYAPGNPNFKKSSIGPGVLYTTCIL